MAEMKFGADLLTQDGRIGGRILISSETFTWKPVRFLFIGAGINDITFPISQLEGYGKKGTTLAIGVKGYHDLLSFYTWKGSSIINAIKEFNPSFGMYDSNEIKF